MKLYFSVYAFVASAAVVVAATTPTVSAIEVLQLPKEPLQDEMSLGTEDLENGQEPGLNDGKHRHLTSSEDAPRPAPAPTCPQRRLRNGDRRHLTSSEDGPPPTEDPCATEPPVPEPTPPPPPTCPERRRHLTSSEDGPPPTEDPCATEPPVPSPTRSPVMTPVVDKDCDYSLDKIIQLKPDKNTTCRDLAKFKWKTLDKKCKKTRFRNQCPGLCDKEKCPCYNNNQLEWEGGVRTLRCSVIAKYDADRLEDACKQPRTMQFCRGVCNSSCPVTL